MNIDSKTCVQQLAAEHCNGDMLDAFMLRDMLLRRGYHSTEEAPAEVVAELKQIIANSKDD